METGRSFLAAPGGDEDRFRCAAWNICARGGKKKQSLEERKDTNKDF